MYPWALNDGSSPLRSLYRADEFARAVYVATGHKFTRHLVNTVFKIFDVDHDDQLSYKEFIGIMQDRLHRRSRVRAGSAGEGRGQQVRAGSVGVGGVSEEHQGCVNAFISPFTAAEVTEEVKPVISLRKRHGTVSMVTPDGSEPWSHWPNGSAARLCQSRCHFI